MLEKQSPKNILLMLMLLEACINFPVPMIHGLREPSPHEPKTYQFPRPHDTRTPSGKAKEYYVTNDKGEETVILTQ